MSLKHSLLSAVFPPLCASNSFLRWTGIKTDDRLRIINFHDVAPEDQERFTVQLKWIARYWTFVSPQRFAAMMMGEEFIKGANLLVTFDDGFASNRRVAEEVLNPLNIQALFFVVPDFVNISDAKDSRTFIARNIYPDMNPEKIPVSWRNMQWNDLAWLLQSGHTIGHHTRTHVRLSGLKNMNEMEDEIIGSANTLGQKLGVEIEHFAYPFGNVESFNSTVLSLARTRFPFIYTGLRGDNADKLNKWAIRRDAIQPYDSLGLTGALLEGAADFGYKQSLTQYESWCQEKK